MTRLRGSTLWTLAEHDNDLLDPAGWRHGLHAPAGGGRHRGVRDLSWRGSLPDTEAGGDIVVMDNLAVHKSPQVTALVEAVGAEVRFLPAFSPDLNPIEKMWSKIKSLLRSYEARAPEELDEAISKAFSKITAKDAMGYFCLLRLYYY
jgi:hypothetical protein